MEIPRNISSSISTGSRHQNVEQAQRLIVSSKDEGNSHNHCATEDGDGNTGSTLHILKTSSLTKENNFQGGITIALELP